MQTQTHPSNDKGKARKEQRKRGKSQKPDPHGIPNRSSGLLGSRGVKRGRVHGSVLRFRIFFTATPPDPRGAAMSTTWGWLGFGFGFSDPKKKRIWLPGEKRRGDSPKRSVKGGMLESSKYISHRIVTARLESLLLLLVSCAAAPS